MPGSVRWTRLRWLVPALTAVAVIVLFWFAGIADSNAAGGTPITTASDLAVGLVFVIASLLATGTADERVIMGAVGPAWLAGSVWASARSLHQAVLAVALLAFPSGRLVGFPRRFLALSALVVGFEVVPQLGVAALFAAVALVALAAVGRTSASFVYPAATGAAVAAAMVFSWWAVQHSPGLSPLVFYEATLFAVALGFAVTTWAVAGSGARLADRALDRVPFAGLPGLRLVLADLLNDANLEIHTWDAVAGNFVDVVSGGPREAAASAGLTVRNGFEPFARVITGSAALGDARTAEAVGAAIRLAVVNHHLRQDQMQRVADLDASRKRLLAATDRERERIAIRLRRGAGARLVEASSTLARAAPGDDGLSELIGFVATQVAAAARDIERIVAGVPPEALGEGRLREALTLLAARTEVPFSLTIGDNVAADADVETTLFYVCSEALANVSKHSGATHVLLDLQRRGNEVLLSVRDNGRGGAQTGGSGLQGLADRLAAVGGRLSVESPPGGGTAVVASLPESDADQRHG